MSKSKSYKAGEKPKPALKSRQRPKPVSTQIGGPNPNKMVLAVVGVLVVALAAWIGWNAWQSLRGPAETQSATVADVQPQQVAADVSASGADDSQAATTTEVQPEEALGGASGSVAAPVEALAVGTQVGEFAPDFSAPTLEGGTFSLALQRGRPTIVFFMAYWCGTCIPEGRALAQLKGEYGDRINIVALDVDPSSTPEALAQFKQAAGNGAFTWAFDTGQKVVAAYEVTALDTTLILDGDGRVVYRDQWPSPYQTLKDELVKLGL